MPRRSVLAFVASLVLLPTAALRAGDHFFDSGGVKIHYPGFPGWALAS